MSYENSTSVVTQSFYNVPVDGRPTNGSAELLNLSEHPLLDDYEPAFRPLVLSGLAAIHWAGQQNPDLLSVPPLNDQSYPPIHPEFVRQAATLNEKGALAAQAGAAILAVTLAYQTWMHATGAEPRTTSIKYQQHETSVKQDVDGWAAQWAAGDILYHPGFGWEVADLSAQHVVNSGLTGAIRLSARVLRTPENNGLESPTPQTEQYYFLNLSTSFNDSQAASRPGWATAKVEAGMIDQGRFATVDDGAGFERLAKLAQVLNSLVLGESYLADMPSSGYVFTPGRTLN
ncbi:MAG TPA: hypothetical protein VLG16_00540 [Candidatus Saccharimonadales bacterium]|nr:hypothetical protein [Candidatus Saccharimonadales bacterium]